MFTRFDKLTREQLNGMASQGYAVVVPLGACEQHGLHLPTGTDNFICDEISRRAVAEAVDMGARLILAPLLPVGSSAHHIAFGGTISFSSATYLSILKDIGASLADSGFNRLIFLNGHGGNEHLMHQAASDLAVTHLAWTASASYWNVAREALAAACPEEIFPVPGHAGGFETSLILSLAPETVCDDRIGCMHPRRPWMAAGPSGAFIGKQGELTGVDGYTDPSGLATGEQGERYLNTIAAAVAKWLLATWKTMDGDTQAETDGSGNFAPNR
ncbi:creatininase family protein [Paenibacillus ihbetae]|uniref:Creatininase n=1 Tax=Paenibacillus ihbetae TaxID=1870820 RepID=A0ABX3JVJ6_9BACL|nr:creatininase family protein [Paenibacillus ihbetae]OOC61381.1 creatininase [Paenibacillus ihbetae]